MTELSNLPDLPQFSNLMSSLTIPITSEATAIQVAINESSRQESVMENMLLQLKDLKRTLKARLDFHHNYRSELQGMVSALRLLPWELLSNIFLMCHPPEDSDDSDRDERSSLTWSIAGVCRKWRQVSHSTPLLWSHIPIDLNRKYGPSRFEKVKTILDLSSPYKVVLRLLDINPEKWRDCLHFLPRVRFLRTAISYTILEILNEASASLKDLEAAKIDFYPVPYDRPRKLSCLANVVNLTLRSHGDSLDVLRAVEIHWPNLTTFHGSDLASIFLCQILSLAPQLQKVTMDYVVNMSFQASAPFVRHAHLRELHLTPWKVASVRFPQELHLPALQILQMRGKLVPHLFPLFQHTQGSLRTLSIESPAQGQAIYSACPNLEELTVWRANSADLKILTISIDSKLCPSLCLLSLPSLFLDSNHDVRVLQEFLSSRGLAPFEVPVLPSDCRPLQSVSFL